MDKTNPEFKSKKVMVSMTSRMKGQLEKAAIDNGVSEAGLLRFLFTRYVLNGGPRVIP